MAVKGPPQATTTASHKRFSNGLIPDIGQRNSVATSQQPPSNFNDALKSQEAFEAALDNLKNSADPSVAALSESWRRTFHPKGTAYSQHSEANINTILSNRQANAAPPPPPPASPTEIPADQDADTCGDWYKVFLDYFEIRGGKFDPTRLVQTVLV